MTRDALAIAADILRLAASGLFDRGFYLKTHPDVADAGHEPLVHFCDIGWRLGYAPNPCFDVAAYLANNPDAAAAAVNPLVHYLEFGEAEGRAALPRFDPAWYRARYRPSGNAMADFLRRQDGDRTDPNPGFDTAWYADEYATALDGTDAPFTDFVLRGAAAGREPSEAARLIRAAGAVDAAFYHRTYPETAGRDPVHDYCMAGWRARRDPSPDFDTGYYLDIYDDVAAAGQNPLAHYIQFGRAENRPARLAAAVPPAEVSSQVEALFDENYYLINYPDVRESGQEPLAHFNSFGAQEGRRANAYFDAEWYNATYLRDRPGVNPLLHYASEGERLGNRPIEYFDPAWYRTRYGLAADASPLRHFLEHRRSQIFSPIPEFDVEAYVAAYGKEIGSNRDPFAHYLRLGITRDIDPGPDFDARRYRLESMGRNPRLRVVGANEIQEKRRRESLNPLVHYLAQRHAPAAVSAAS